MTYTMQALRNKLFIVYIHIDKFEWCLLFATVWIWWERERGEREFPQSRYISRPALWVWCHCGPTLPGVSQRSRIFWVFFLLFLPDHPQSDISVIPRGLTICSHALSSHVTMLVLSLASSRGKWDSVESLSRHLGVLFGWFVPFRGDLREYKLR